VHYSDEAQEIPALGKTRLGEFPSAFSLSIGDVISVGDLIHLADPFGRDGDRVMDESRDGKGTLRNEGGVLVVAIHYTNSAKMDPFAQSPVRYVITATFMPMQKFKQVAHVPLPDGGRRVTNTHGLLIQAQIHGQVRSFAFGMLLRVVTTGMALLAASQIMTNMIMLHIMADKDKYNILKFQPTQAFDKLRKLQKKQKQHYGEAYDELNHKPAPVADFLSDIFEPFKGDLTSKPPEEVKGIFHAVEEEVIKRTNDRLKPDSALDQIELEKRKSWWLDILSTFIRHEQRLNRLDGMDEHNLGAQSEEKMAKFYAAWEEHYWDRQGWHPDLRPPGRSQSEYMLMKQMG